MFAFPVVLQVLHKDFGLLYFGTRRLVRAGVGRRALLLFFLFKHAFELVVAHENPNRRAELFGTKYLVLAPKHAVHVRNVAPRDVVWANTKVVPDLEKLPERECVVCRRQRLE